MTGRSAMKLQVDALLTDAADQVRVPGVVVAVANSSGLIYQGVAGVRSLATGATMKQDTIMSIASMTKTITTVTVLQLMEQDRLVLDARVSE